MADPAAKPTNPAGASAGKPAGAPAPAAPAPAPAAGANAAPGTSPAAKPGPAAGPKPIASVDDLIERAEDRLIAKGSTVRLSPDHPDVSSKARRDELEDSLEACGIKVVWDKTVAKDAIVVESGAKK